MQAANLSNDHIIEIRIKVLTMLMEHWETDDLAELIDDAEILEAYIIKGENPNDDEDNKEAVKHGTEL